MAAPAAHAQFAVVFNPTNSVNPGSYGHTTEGGSAYTRIQSFPNTGGGQPTEDVTVTCTPRTDSGVTAGDFRDSAAATTPSATVPTVTLTWTVAELSAGGSIKNCVFYTYDDAQVESLENIVIVLTAAGAGASILSTTDMDTGVVSVAQGGIAIADNDANAITISVAADAATVAETAANVAFTVTAQGAATAAAISVPFTVSGSATRGAGITASPVSIPMGAQNAARTATITVPIDETDTLIDNGETVTVTLGTLPAVAGLTVRSGATTATTLVNDDGDDTAARTLTVTGPAGGSITEGSAGTFNIGITGTAFTSPTAVTWTVTHGDTTDADFSAVTGSITFPTQTSFSITPAADNLDEADTEAFTVQVSVANPTADMGTAIGTAASLSITDNDTVTVTLTGPAALGEEEMATYTVNLGAIPMAAVTVEYEITGSGVPTGTGLTLTITPPAASGTITLTTDDGGGRGTPDRTFTIAITDVTGGATPAGRPMLTVTVTEDDPAARAARVKIPLAAFAKGAAQLAADAVSQRLSFTGNALTENSFSLNLKDAGFNLWASGSRINTDGNDNGIAYDGHTKALHLGADTEWHDGLLGIAVGQSAGDTDFSNADANSTLKTSVVSLHPYFTRTADNRKLWATIGYGTGEAELREDGESAINTGVTLLTAAGGVTFAESKNAAITAAAHWSRAELDSATAADGRHLPAVTAGALRIDAGLEAGVDIGEQWRPFLTVNLRHDSGDGDDGNAADYGAGVEWQNGNAHLRLAGRKHAQGRGPDEEQLTLTARKTAGRLNLGLHLTANDGLNTANLLTGELRF